MESVKDMIETKRRERELAIEKRELWLEENPKPDQSEFCQHGKPRHDFEIEPSGEIFRWKEIMVSCPDCSKELRASERSEGVNESLSIPKRYQKAPVNANDIEDFDLKGGIVFSGDVGTGKTYRAVSLVKYLFVQRGVHSQFDTGTDIAMRLKSSIAENRYQEIVKKLRESELLFIDDLGVESATDFVRESLYNILNHRYNELLPVVFTTNLSSKEFADAYGQRLLSRLVEMAEFVKLTGGDRRVDK